MKPKTKNILLGVSLGLNLLLGLLVGGALIKSCADKPAQNASSGLSLSSSVKMHDRNAKKALEPENEPHNYIEDAVWYNGAWATSITTDVVTIKYAPYQNRGFYMWGFDDDKNTLPAGVYRFHFEPNPEYSAQAGYGSPRRLFFGDFQLGVAIADCVKPEYQAETFNVQRSGLNMLAQFDTDPADVYFKYDPAQYSCFSVMVYGNFALKINLVDTLTVAPEDVITFPVDYNPLVMFGTPYEGYSWGTISGGNGAQTILKDLSGVFRIDDAIYDEIHISFHQMLGMAYLATDGTIQTFPANGDASVYYPVSLSARPFGGGQRVDLWALKQGYANGAPYISNVGYWRNATRQSIAVVYYDPSAVGLSPIFPTYSVLDLLKVRTASSSSVPTIGGDGNADVFGLLGQGFTAVAGIMNIQILPYLTLGTLVFVPLVVLVILAILKVLNK